MLDRVRSWIIEDAEVATQDYDFKGKHLLDIRRAFQAACLLYGADPAEWGDDVEWLMFSKNDLADCSDTAPDQIKGWIAVLEPHVRPTGNPSTNVGVIYSEGPLKDIMIASGLIEDFADHARHFDWPRSITIHFNHCNRGAFWNRSNRVIMLCDDCVQRFIEQTDKADDL